jgi:serine/threonine-protein kinase
MDQVSKIALGKDIVIFDRAAAKGSGLYGEKEDISYLEFRNRVVTITPLMKEILEICRAPHTANEVVQLISGRLQCSHRAIDSSVDVFLKRMMKLGVLVPESELRRRDPAAEFEKVQKLGDFKLLEELGRNRKVRLYKCADDNGNLHAIKLKIGGSPDGSFMREFEILKSLPPHENIRKCIDASAHHGMPFIVFEYVDGRPMSDITEDFSIDTKYFIAWQMLSAISHIHHHKILHGDIHASNFLIGQSGHVHVIDFGMSFREHEEDVDHGGVPQYMSPERMPDHNYLFSKRKGDYVSEIFQVGVCLYLLFSGQYPFNGELLKDVRKLIQFESPSPLTQTDLGEPIPHQFSEIIYRALEKDPAARYQDIQAMICDWTTLMIRNGAAPKESDKL